MNFTERASIHKVIYKSLNGNMFCNPAGNMRHKYKRKKDTPGTIKYGEVITMLFSVWLMLSSLLCSLQLSTGSFPKPLTEEEERHYLELSAQGDIEARNILVERNLRLVAHIMNKG